MSKRNLYETISVAKKYISSRRGKTSTEILMNVLSLCDGKTDLDTICKKNKISKQKLKKAIEILEKNKLIYKTKL